MGEEEKGSEPVEIVRRLLEARLHLQNIVVGTGVFLECGEVSYILELTHDVVGRTQCQPY